MTTAARPTTEASCHWYDKLGNPVYEVPRATGDGLRPTTLADARKLNLLPSVTTILGVLHKEALVQWRVEQAVLACLTSKRNDGELLDDFVKCVLHDERVQEQESDIAKKRGTEIHAACEAVINGMEVDAEIQPWIMPALAELQRMKLKPVATEHVLVGVGYAGRSDLIAMDPKNQEWVIDFKTTKRLPQKESYWEHRMQTAAYVRCRLEAQRHANVYISTVNQGEFVIHDNGDYLQPYAAFENLLRYWQAANNYHP